MRHRFAAVAAISCLFLAHAACSAFGYRHPLLTGIVAGAAFSGAAVFAGHALWKFRLMWAPSTFIHGRTHSTGSILAAFCLALLGVLSLA